ncbi:uncharacterized protein LOC125766003 [Anopheles funestus]|uniref:uncharacterized protein LOC125766003 n=1 Tax=Anopheles funestus TaxID=62324 RepID=UPI0020C70F13|nr:uncharacterized protein LOC125766003 [Anopheles funestus]
MEQVIPVAPQSDKQQIAEVSAPAMSGSDKYILSLRTKHKQVQRKLTNMNIEQQDLALSQVQQEQLLELKEIQSRLMNLIIEQMPDDVEDDLDQDEAFHTLYATKAAKVAVIDKKPAPEAAPPCSSTSMQHHLSIPMPTFDGQYEHWPKFKALFLDIMARTNESDAVKLHHLNKALQGKAAGILNASLLNSNNFQSAWDVLVKRFENSRLIVEKHIAGLLQLKHVPKQSAKELRTLAESCKSHVDGLVFMKQSIDSTSNLIITNLLTSCLDVETRKTWESSLEHGKFPDLYKTLDFIHRQCEVLESCTSQEKPSRKMVSTNALTTTTPASTCVVCNEDHPLQRCPKFLALSVADKVAKVRSLKRCFNCLCTGHNVIQCPSKRSCRVCNRRHHSLLHKEESRPASALAPRVDVQPPPSSEASTTSLTTAVPSTVLLPTVLLNITDRGGISHPARALLDSGSQSNFITERMAQLLDLPRKLINLPLAGIGGSTGSNVRHSVKTTIYSRCSSYTSSIELLVLPKLSVDMPTHELNISHWKVPETCILADPFFNRPGTIDVILGTRHFFEVLRIGRLSLGDNMPTLQETEFGWIVSGSATIAEPSSPVMCTIALHTNQLGDLMKQAFAIEDLSNTPSCSREERASEVQLAITSTRDDDRYVVQLLRKPEMIGKLGDSKNSTLRRLQREPDTQRAHINLDEHFRLLHMSKVADSSVNDNSFYLPHHPVFKADCHRTTTKWREVLHASSNHQWCLVE